MVYTDRQSSVRIDRVSTEPIIGTNTVQRVQNIAIVSPSKKPRLSLTTLNLSSFTRNPLQEDDHGVEVSEALAATPTARNTYTNTLNLANDKPLNHEIATAPTTLFTSGRPYKVILPFGVKSILRNSPLLDFAQSASASANFRDSKRKAFFPQPKKVAFKIDLVEVIGSKDESDLLPVSPSLRDTADKCEEGNVLYQDVLSALRCRTLPLPSRKRKRSDHEVSEEESTNPKKRDSTEHANIRAGHGVSSHADPGYRARAFEDETKAFEVQDDNSSVILPLARVTGSSIEIVSPTQKEVIPVNDLTCSAENDVCINTETK